jgi:hypothetical protein
MGRPSCQPLCRQDSFSLPTLSYGDTTCVGDADSANDVSDLRLAHPAVGLPGISCKMSFLTEHF